MTVANRAGQRMSGSTPVRIAAVLLWSNAVGFGLPCLLAIHGPSTGRGIATFMGYPTYGAGPLERLGVHTTVPLVTAFLLVCALEGVAGYLLWGGHRAGAIFALALLPAGAVLW